MFEFWPTIFNIALAIIGGILSNRADKWLSAFSQTRKENYEKKKDVLEKTVQYILANPHEETNLRIRATNRGLMTILALTTALFLSLINNNIVLIVSFALSCMGVYGYYKSSKLQRILDKVNFNKKQTHPEIDLDIYVPKK